MKSVVLTIGMVLVLTTAGCIGGDGPRMKEVELTEAQKLFKAKTTFKDGVFAVEVRRQDGTTKTLDSVLNYDSTFALFLPRPSLPGSSIRVWRLSENTYDGRTFVYALVNWDEDDPADYLSAGWWLHVPPDLSYRDLRQAESGVFIDGPELDLSNPPQMPVAGEAKYVGIVGGLYRYQPPNGGLEDHEYSAIMDLTANFSDHTLSGCIGCIGDIDTQRLYLYTLLGWRPRDPSAPPTDYEVHLGATPFNPDGTFEHTDITVVHPVRTVTQSSGQWAGQFSNVPDGDGNPRRIVGFNDVEFGEADGSSARLIGIFEALSPANQPPPESEAP